ncbi:hypothetical protein FDI69_gp208 [Rhodococcus phage Trina]|uniref:Uncharacterized protein n=1 Tax=Rhodococcus phage Trina TaxID=2027905 RepID=A0A2D0ZNM3_9CAUD|nr:hypothetical protein FDI69_gp208 [Rhodococcus phage Trina]ASZ74978.1 hypothetical protein SEA_TRINA_198 [Rhodococcus phage Trina]
MIENLIESADERLEALDEEIIELIIERMNAESALEAQLLITNSMADLNSADREKTVVQRYTEAFGNDDGPRIAAGVLGGLLYTS